jgi:NAD(P)-dependent dehydrogenase (short-subunit alcohol dehydrogenase family)
MGHKNDSRKNRTNAPVPTTPAVDRRQFIGAALGTGGLLASMGLAHYARAQNAAAPAVRPPPPPEPAVSQPAPLRDLKGKVAYVTAGSDGIGLGIARAASNAGMKVVIGYRNEERLKAALPLFKPGNAGVHAVKHDVVGREGWQALLDEVKKTFGKLHLVVNNAGIKTLKPASQASYEEWDLAMAVNVSAIVQSVAVIRPHMLEHGEGGHFVTTSSMSGLLPAVTAGVYSATKIAAVGVMEALRIELEGTNIGTSAFCPGATTTDNYFASGQPNPRSTGGRRASPVPMDPLEAGERVMNGVVHNDLFIVSHPEFAPGMKQRFDAMMASTPTVETPIPQARIDYEQRVLRAGIYPREIEHRKKPRKSYRSTEA